MGKVLFKVNVSFLLEKKWVIRYAYECYQNKNAWVDGWILFCRKIPGHYAPAELFLFLMDRHLVNIFLEKKLEKNIGLVLFGKNQ